MYSYQTIKKILVATDGSDPSVHAGEYAISIAKSNNAQLIVVSIIDDLVIEQFSRTMKENISRELKTDAQKEVNHIVNLAEKQGVTASSVVAKGRPYEQIIHAAKDANVDLIVMGTYGRRGTERMLIGSVAERVIEYSSCPVLVVK
jgi:nucleotide-binding universal stress UspA family protein